MPVQTSYPGVYIEELPSSVHTVTGAATSNAAFVDFFSRGPMNQAVKVGSFREFENHFGGLDRRSEASYGLMQFFNNGGSEAFIVRVAQKDTAVAASYPCEITGPSIDDTKNDAAVHAANADKAAKAANAVKVKLGTDTLSDDIKTVATETANAAIETAAAAEDAKRAAQELEIYIEEDEALNNQPAVDAAGKAQAAALDADAKAKLASKAAADAATAKGKLDPTKPDTIADAKTKVAAATVAASNAAKAAGTAAKAAAAAKAFAAQVAAAAGGPTLSIQAANEGIWGNNLKIGIVVNPVIPHGASANEFDVVVGEFVVHRGVQKMVRSERHTNLTLDTNQANYAVKVINHDSNLIRMNRTGLAADGAYPKAVDLSGHLPQQPLAGGKDGSLAGAEDFVDGMTQGLSSIAPDVFNILCLPAVANYANHSEAEAAYTEALGFCKKSRAFLLIDPPTSESTAGDPIKDIQDWTQPFRNADTYSGAVYFPLLKMPDPLHGYRPRIVAPSGAIAGIYARTDASRGVWKAPAGIEAAIQGAEPAVTLHDEDSGTLNPLGINVLRSFPVYGNVVWGARTLAGADLLGSQWKYVSIRRLADYIEDSLFQSLKWVVFEPNDEATWAQIRLEIGSFMAGLFADGAFVGETPDQGYLVKVDSETTTQLDIDQGRVNIVVGFAPVKPAEFVILEIQQLAGQTAS